MNCMRIPALQSLLLYARSLDTNADLTRILCDDWLEICFLNEETAKKVVSIVIYLRNLIEKLYQIRLENRSNSYNDININKNTQKNKYLVDKLENLFIKKLNDFLESAVLYSLRRILPAELKDLKKPDTKILETENKSIISKNGYRITEYLIYNR